MFRALKDRGDFGLLLPDDTLCNNRLKRPVIAVNARWKPDCDPKAVVAALRCAAPASNELVPSARNNRGMCSKY
jgi:hypothetical protein